MLAEGNKAIGERFGWQHLTGKKTILGWRDVRCGLCRLYPYRVAVGVQSEPGPWLFFTFLTN